MAEQHVVGLPGLRSRDASVRRRIPGSQMMTDASASERAYQHLRGAILDGKLRPEILDIRMVGDQLKMSVTPVREALARLSAERLVRFVPHHGYTVVRLTAQRLEELYDLSGLLAEACLRRVAHDTLVVENHAISPLASGYADKITALLQTIANAQANRELLALVESVNGRLFLARQAEPKFISDAVGEAANLAALWARQELAELSQQLEIHHRSRTVVADQLARVLDMSPDAS